MFCVNMIKLHIYMRKVYGIGLTDLEVLIKIRMLYFLEIFRHCL